MWMTRRGREKIGKTHHKIRSDTFRPAGIDAFYILLFCASGSVGLHLTQLEMSRWVLQARLFIHYLSGRLLHLQLFVLCRSFSIAMFASEKMHRGLVSTCKSISIQVSLLTFTCNEIAACSSNVHWIYIYIQIFSIVHYCSFTSLDMNQDLRQVSDEIAGPLGNVPNEKATVSKQLQNLSLAAN